VLIGNTNNPRAGPAIKALAIGMPLTTDFCDPQKTIALSSARSNRRARLPLIIISGAVARKASEGSDRHVQCSPVPRDGAYALK
jgi:hypothetical protein